MKRFKSLVWLPLLGVSLSAATFNLNTGAAGSLWEVTQTSGNPNGPALNALSPAAVLTGTLPFASSFATPVFFSWADPFGGAVWIGQLATDGQFSDPGRGIVCGTPCGATQGVYTYTYTFNGVQN